jgi:hypothetical protein
MPARRKHAHRERLALTKSACRLFFRMMVAVMGIDFDLVRSLSD